jgi:hypothetical protein
MRRTIDVERITIGDLKIFNGPMSEDDDDRHSQDGLSNNQGPRHE